MDAKEFESLSLEEQRKAFHESPLKERGELLTYSQDPSDLIKSVSHEELYLMTREMDIDEKKEVIRYAGLGQLFFISDVDLWMRDQIHPRQFMAWLETLIEAGEAQLARWITSMDYETVIAGLQKICYVVKPEREYPIDEVLGDTNYFTLDEFYYICVREENMETVKRIVQVIYERYRGKYAAILEGIMGDMPDELEEEGYRRRGIRLSGRGFPEAEDAPKIYRRMTHDEFEAFPLKSKFKDLEAEEDGGNAGYPSIWNEEVSFLNQVLQLFKGDPETLEGLHEEITWLSNKVIAADGLDFSSEEKVRKGVRRARGIVSVGLEILSGKNLSKAKVIVSQRWLEAIFSRTFSIINELQNEADALVKKYWDGSKPDFFGFLNAPYDQIMQGIFLRIPQYCELKEKGTLRDFMTSDEVELTRKALGQITLAHRVLSERLHVDLKRLRTDEKISGEALTLYSLFATAFVLHSRGVKDTFRALNRKEIESFFKDAFEGSGAKVILAEKFKNSFSDLLGQGDDEAVLRPLRGLVFDELRRLKLKIDQGKIDLKLLTSLVMEK